MHLIEMELSSEQVDIRAHCDDCGKIIYCKFIAAVVVAFQREEFTAFETISREESIRWP